MHSNNVKVTFTVNNHFNVSKLDVSAYLKYLLNHYLVMILANIIMIIIPVLEPNYVCLTVGKQQNVPYHQKYSIDKLLYTIKSMKLSTIHPSGDWHTV